MSLHLVDWNCAAWFTSTFSSIMKIKNEPKVVSFFGSVYFLSIILLYRSTKGSFTHVSETDGVTTHETEEWWIPQVTRYLFLLSLRADGSGKEYRLLERRFRRSWWWVLGTWELRTRCIWYIRRVRWRKLRLNFR